MGFCLLGVIGECGPDITTIQEVSKHQQTKITETLNEKLVKTMTEMRATSTNIQRVSCIAIDGDCIIDGVRMRQMAEVTTEGIANINKNLKGDAIVDLAIDAASEAYLDYENKGTTGGMRKTFTDTERELIQYAKTEMRNVVRDDTFTNCSAMIINEQVVEGKSANGDVVIRMIDMEQTSKAIANCVVSTVIDLIQNIKNNETLTSKLKSENKMYQTSTSSQLVETAGETVKAIAQEAGKTTSNIADNIFYLILAIIIIIGAIFLIKIVLGK